MEQIFLIAFGLYDIYLISFVVKNFRLNLFLKNLKKNRNIFLIILSIVLTCLLVFSMTESEPYAIIFLAEIIVWIWIQALFSD